MALQIHCVPAQDPFEGEWFEIGISARNGEDVDWGKIKPNWAIFIMRHSGVETQLHFKFEHIPEKCIEMEGGRHAQYIRRGVCNARIKILNWVGKSAIVVTGNDKIKEVKYDPLRIVRFRLELIYVGWENPFLKDEGGGGKRNKLRVVLVGPGGPCKIDQIIPLRVRLLKAKLREKVENQSILQVDKCNANPIYPEIPVILENGEAEVSFRVNDVSRNHKSDFLIELAPAFRNDISCVTSNFLNVMSKKNKSKSTTSPALPRVRPGTTTSFLRRPQANQAPMLCCIGRTPGSAQGQLIGNEHPSGLPIYKLRRLNEEGAAPLDERGINSRSRMISTIRANEHKQHDHLHDSQPVDSSNSNAPMETRDDDAASNQDIGTRNYIASDALNTSGEASKSIEADDIGETMDFFLAVMEGSHSAEDPTKIPGGNGR